LTVVLIGVVTLVGVFVKEVYGFLKANTEHLNAVAKERDRKPKDHDS